MRRPSFLLTALLVTSSIGAYLALAEPTTQPVLPEVGQTAPNFTLKTLDQKSIALYELTNQGTVVLVTLRGWPGYQCPICTKQVADLIKNAQALADAKAHVLLVYPGPSAELQADAQAFIGNSNLPANFTFVIDPDYTFTNLYHLRWDEKGETAYPSTFVIDRASKITYAKISKTHGGRAPINDVIDAVNNAK